MCWDKYICKYSDFTYAPQEESKIILSGRNQISPISNPFPKGSLIVKLCQIMAAQKAFVTFSKDSGLSDEPIIFLNKYKIFSIKL